MQRRYFESAGQNAWRGGAVPHYITSNPRMAAAWLAVITGYLRDQRAAGALDPSQPLYIVDVGAGSGRFAFHFLSRLVQDLPPPFVDLAWTYVITDGFDSNVSALRAHPAWRPFLEAGRLEFCVFDPLESAELLTYNEKIFIGNSGAANPVIYVANYFFDGLPAEALRFTDQQGVARGMVSLYSTRPEADPTDPEILARSALLYDFEPLEESGGPFAEDPVIADLIGEYQQQRLRTHLLLPTASFTALERLAVLAPRGMLLLSADKGYHSLADLDQNPEPGVSVHGSLSLMVNYHALAFYAGRVHRALVRFGDRDRSGLCCAAFLFPVRDQLEPPALTLYETMFAFGEAVERGGGPDDWFAVKKSVEKNYDAFDLPRLLSYIRLSEYDANVCFGARHVLRERLLDAIERDDGLVQETHAVLRHVLERYFPLGQERADLFFMIGSLFYESGAPADATACFERSLEWHGEDAGTLYNLALCATQLNQPGAALEFVERALQLDADFAEARELRERLENEPA